MLSKFSSTPVPVVPHIAALWPYGTWCNFRLQNLIPGNFPVLLVIVGILNSYAVSCADAIAVTVQRASLGASRLQGYLLCPACSEILALTRNSIEPIVPHRLSVRKAIGQSAWPARVLILNSSFVTINIFWLQADTVSAGEQNRRKENNTLYLSNMSFCPKSQGVMETFLQECASDDKIWRAFL